MKTAHRNVTLSLPEPLLRQFRVYAAQRNQSMSSLMAEAIRATMDQEDERARAAKRLIERMRNAPAGRLRGRITWTRDELYERHK